jgi:hypothetical protein
VQTIIHGEGIENQTEVMNVESAKAEKYAVFNAVKSVKNILIICQKSLFTSISLSYRIASQEICQKYFLKSVKNLLFLPFDSKTMLLVL